MHLGPSTIGIDTIQRSRGIIPDAFLIKAGVSEQLLDCIHSSGRVPFDYYTCFISYSSGQSKMILTGLRAGRDMKGDHCDAGVIAGCYTPGGSAESLLPHPALRLVMNSDLDSSAEGARCSRRFWDQAEKRMPGGGIHLGI